MSSPAPRSSREKVRDFRARQRAKGLRLVQFWVPDVNSPEFKAAIRAECLAIASSASAKDDMAFVESIADYEGWGEWNEK